MIMISLIVAETCTWYHGTPTNGHRLISIKQIYLKFHNKQIQGGRDCLLKSFFSKVMKNLVIGGPL